MNYLKTKKMKLVISLTALFMLFQIYKFFKVRIISIGLPKGKIVFSADIDGDNEIYTMNINGTGLEQLTHNAATKTSINIAIDEEPSFSPDGKKVVFASGRQEPEKRKIIIGINGKPIGEEFSGGASDIYIMDLDGKNQIPLTYSTLSSHPFFSSDGEKVIFRTLILTDRRNLVKMINIDGSGEKTLSNSGGQVEFSPDGKKIFDNFESDVSVADVEGTNRKRLTHLNDDKQAKLGIDFLISPDGKKLTVITSENKKLYRPDDIYDFYDIFEFYTMNVDGSNLEKIYRIDGSALDDLYRFDEARRISGWVTRVREHLPDGSVRTKVYRQSDLKGYGGTIWQFKFSPNGKYIVFNADFGSKIGVYLLSLEDKTVISLMGEKEKWNKILDFTFTPDGKRIVFFADIYPKNYYFHAVILRNIKAYIKYFLFRKQTPYYDNKYICIIDLNGENYRRIAKLPIGSDLGRDFIHWED